MRERDRAAVEALVQEWAGTNRQMPPVRARVVKSDSTRPGKADALTPRYTIDVQVLMPDGSDAEVWPVLHEVEVDVLWAGGGRGVWALPAVGSIVRLGFYYNDPAQPFVDGVVQQGQDVPAHGQGELVITQAGEAVIRIKSDGTLELGVGEDILAGLVRQCDVCSLTGGFHPAASGKVKAR